MFDMVAQDLNPGPLGRESEALATGQLGNWATGPLGLWASGPLDTNIHTRTNTNMTWEFVFLPCF